MVDPKKVEFMMYDGIPHLLIPVVTDPKKAAGALAWAVNEMLNRYKQFSDNNVRDFTGFNELAKDPDSGLMKMSHIVIFIDELADLMMASPKRRRGQHSAPCPDGKSRRNAFLLSRPSARRSTS